MRYIKRGVPSLDRVSLVTDPIRERSASKPPLATAPSETRRCILSSRYAPGACALGRYPAFWVNALDGKAPILKLLVAGDLGVKG
jgi:hypothetical protein